MTNEEAKRLYEEAVRRYDGRDFAGALELLDRVESERPNSRHIIYHSALCLAALGRVDAARICLKKLEGRIDPNSLERLEKEIADATPAKSEEVAAAGGLEDSAAPPPEGSENIFVVQAVYPISTEECSVVGRVKKGVFHTDDIANVVGAEGALLPAPIMRIGPADTPLLLAREGQRSVMVLRIDPNQISSGTSIICETRRAAHAVTMVAPSKSSKKASLLERPAELAPVEKLMKQGAYREAEHLLNAYTAQHPTSIVAKRMLAQVYLESDSPLRDPSKALYLIRMVYQAGGAEDPVVTNLLAQAQAETGDPEMGLRFLERLYASTLDVEAKQALAQRIHGFRSKYGLGEVWEFADAYGDVIFESHNSSEAVRAILNGVVPLDAGCRRNHVGNFEPVETTLAPLYPEVAALYKPQQTQQSSPVFILIMAFLILGIIVAWFLPSLLRMMQ